MTKKHLIYLTLILIFTGLAVFLYKAAVLDFPLAAKARSDIWHIEAHLVFVSNNNPVKISMNLPRNSHRFTIISENFISRGYGALNFGDERPPGPEHPDCQSGRPFTKTESGCTAPQPIGEL